MERFSRPELTDSSARKRIKGETLKAGFGVYLFCVLLLTNDDLVDDLNVVL